MFFEMAPRRKVCRCSEEENQGKSLVEVRYTLDWGECDYLGFSFDNLTVLVKANSFEEAESKLQSFYGGGVNVLSMKQTKMNIII